MEKLEIGNNEINFQIKGCFWHFCGKIYEQPETPAPAAPRMSKVTSMTAGGAGEADSRDPNNLNEHLQVTWHTNIK